MEISQATLEAAMKAAVASGMLAKHADEATYLRNWDGMKTVLTAALAVQPTEQGSARSIGDDAGPVATVIKNGADRQWMSENLGALPDGMYSLYLRPAAPLAPSDTQGAKRELPELPQPYWTANWAYSEDQMCAYARAALAQQAPDAVQDAPSRLTDEQILRELRRECDNAFKVLRAHEHEMLANRLNSCVIDIERRLAPKLAEAGKGE